jgi:hypothetical protein
MSSSFVATIDKSVILDIFSLSRVWLSSSTWNSSASYASSRKDKGGRVKQCTRSFAFAVADRLPGPRADTASNVVASESPAFSPSFVSRPETYCHILWVFSSSIKNEDCLLSTFLKVCTYKKEMDSKIKQVDNFTFECLPKGVHRKISWGFRGFALPRMVIESSETIVHDLHHSSFSLRLR